MLKLKSCYPGGQQLSFVMQVLRRKDVTREEALSCHFDGDALSPLVSSLKDRVELTERRR